MEIGKKSISKIVFSNSIYMSISILVSKIGGLIFMILLARLLLPELFGAYSLVLSIVVIMISLTNLGLSDTLVAFVSEALGKKEFSKARAYFKYLLKLKGVLIIILILTTFSISRFLSYTIFDKPLIFIPLLVSLLLIAVESLRGFISALFLAIKDFRQIPFLEFILQSLKIFFSLFAIYFLPDNLKLPGIFFALFLSGFIYIIISLAILIKKEKRIFFGEKINIEKSKILNYLKFVSVAAVSLLFFGSIDTLMLGKFVDFSYIGYYRAALGLILTAASIFSFLGILFPIFTQIYGDRLERGFKKIFRYVVLLSIPTVFGTILFSKYLIFAIYGNDYSLSTSSLYILSILIFTAPIFELYSMLFKAKEKVKSLAKFIIIALFLNIILNYIFIKIFFELNQEYVIMGVAFATVLSRSFLLSLLILKTKSDFKIKIPGHYLLKPIIASIVMAIFIISFNSFFDINLFLGIIEILFSILIYFSTLWFIKGIDSEDVDFFKNLIKRDI